MIFLVIIIILIIITIIIIIRRIVIVLLIAVSNILQNSFPSSLLLQRSVNLSLVFRH